MRNFIFLMGFILSYSAMGHPSQGTRHLSIQFTDHHKTILELKSLGYEIAGIDYENQTIEVITTPDKEWDLNFNTELEIVEARELDQRSRIDDGYVSVMELKDTLDGLVAGNGSIAEVRVIGKSLQDRDIYAVKISDDVQVDDNEEPNILFNSMHHAREIMTVEVAVDMIEYLTTRYDSDPQVRDWVDNNEIWVIPMLNPDGNYKVWNGSSNWRKNGRSVDINRNYPFRWGDCRGSSGWWFMSDYRGQGPASEPETNVMMEFVEEVQPVFNISYHSFSELVIYPYGCRGQHVEDQGVVEGLGRELAGRLVRDSGEGTYTAGTAWETLYPVDGGDIDWMYETHGVIPYVIEVNSKSLGFRPAYRHRDRTVENQRPGWQLLLERLNKSGVRGTVKGLSRLERLTTPIELRPLGQSGETVKRTHIKPDGSFHLVAVPGMYELTIGSGASATKQNIVVGDELVRL